MKDMFSRRSFMKLASTAVCGGAVSGVLQPGITEAASQTAVPRAPEMLRTVRGYCPFCQSRCTYDAHIAGGKIKYLTGTPENEWTGGGMCPKGMSIVELMNSPHRVTEPLLREGNAWKSISYAAAIDLVAEKLTAAKAKHGAGVDKRLALTATLWDCRESELAALMTMRFAGCINIMPPGEVCISTASNTLSTLLGSGNSTTTVDEIVKAETLVLWAANLTETYPPYTRWLDKARRAGVKIIYVDCRKTSTSNFCSTQYSPKPGTDGPLVLGAIRWLIANDAVDTDYVAANAANFEMLKSDTDIWPVSAVAKATGMSEASITEFYQTLARSKRTVVWMGGALSRYSNGMTTIRSLVALQVLRNNLMGSGQGLLTMESGKPEGEKEFVDHICGPASGQGVNFRRLLSSMNKDEIDVLFLNSSYRRYPDCNGVRDALRKVDFVVHRGFFKTEELDVTTLFMPAAFSPESQGSHYGAEKQIVWREKCVDAPGSCVADWQFYRDVGRKIAPDKYPKFETPEELFTMFNTIVPEWKGITLERLRKTPGGLIGPIEELDGPEQPGCIFTDGKFKTPNGKTDFAPKLLGPLVWQPPKGNPAEKNADVKYPLTLIQGKLVTQWQQTLTNFAASLAQFNEGRFVLVHPETAKKAAVVNDEMVYLETAFGKIPAKVRVTEEIIPGVVFTPSHYTGTSPYANTRAEPINTILPSYWDRVSAQFNGLGCTLSKQNGRG